ncbi:MAG: 5-oxoprolinase/urea amidolyase family protein [Microbacterium sp.]
MSGVAASHGAVRGAQRRRILPCGDDAVLVELSDLDEATALAASLRADPVPGVAELVAGARTVLVRLEGAADRDAVVAAIRFRGDGAAPDDGALVEVRAVYDGEDLAEVAELTGLSPEEVVARHSAAVYRVAFTGFAPGFAYLSGLDPELAVPRRATPRPRIPAGALAVAGDFTAVYPRSSPGGWRLVGRALDEMWRLDRDPPALLRPGTRVRFVPVDAAAESEPASGSSSRDEAIVSGERPAARPAIEVVSAGPHALIEDVGRPGEAGIGVSPSGAMDRGALRRANAFVGNDRGAAAIETALGGLVLRARGPVTVAVTGAEAPVTLRLRGGAAQADPPEDVREAPAPFDAPFALADGDELVVGAAVRGVYSTVAVRGGIEVDPVLGSRSRDVLSGLGPAPLAPGAQLPVGSRIAGAAQPWAAPPPALAAAGEEVWLDVVLGPRDDWFARAAILDLTDQDWVVQAQSNRVGLRLAGARPLERAREGELPSEATVTGALQVPPDGQPILFTADRPLTGGYPVIAVVTVAHLDRAAQAPPGARLRFRAV